MLELGPSETRPSGTWDRAVPALAQQLAERLPIREPWLLSSALRNPGALFSFDHLNNCLNTRLVMPPQLRIFCEGKEILPREYVEAYRGHRRSLVADRLRGILARGATMVVNNYDDLTPSMRDLARALESLTGVGVGCNLYASWPPAAGFDVHFDQHDVVVLQVAGAKTWHIYDQAEQFPTASSVLPAYQDREPSKSLLLEVGDILFLPRGLVHSAVAEECCSVHLSVSFEVLGARQLVDATIAQALCAPAFQGDFVALSEPERANLTARLKDGLSDMLSALSIDSFMQSRVGQPRRPVPVELAAALRPKGAVSALNGKAEK